MDVIKIQFKKQVKGVDAGEVELTWISPLKTKQYFIMDDYKYVIVVENVEVVVINVKKLIIKGLAIQKQEKMELTITSAHKKSVNLHVINIKILSLMLLIVRSIMN